MAGNKSKGQGRGKRGGVLASLDLESRSLLRTLQRDIERGAEHRFAAREQVVEAGEAATPEAARVHLERALELAPGLPEALLALANLDEREPGSIERFRAAEAAARADLEPGAFDLAPREFAASAGAAAWLHAALRLASELRDSGRPEEARTLSAEVAVHVPPALAGAGNQHLECLLALGREQEGERFLADAVAATDTGWAWQRALLARRLEGDSERARGLAREAIRRFPAMAIALLGEPSWDGPVHEPSAAAAGQAAELARKFRRYWREAPGAVPWLRRLATEPWHERVRAREQESLLPLLRRAARLRQLPETWEVLARPFASRVGFGFERPHTWMTMIASQQRGPALGHDSGVARPSAQAVLRTVLVTMAEDALGESARPAEVAVTEADWYEHLRAALAPIGVECRLAPSVPEATALCEAFAVELGGSPSMPALFSGPGVTNALGIELADAGQEFYERAPWRAASDEDLIEIAAPALGPSPRYGLILGAAGIELGLVLYERLADAREQATAQPASRSVPPSLSLLLGEPHEVDPRVVAHLEAAGWRPRFEEAYPSPMRVDRERQVTAPGARDMAWLIVALRAVPGIAAGRARDCLEPLLLVVEQGGTRHSATLRWVGPGDSA